MSESATELPFISILVMGHNQGAFMESCLQSVFSQQYEGPLEFVLCDDCSDDDTFDIMQRMAAQYAGPCRVIAHRCPVNGKVAANMNTAVGLSHGDWLMRVDGDDVLHPDRVRLTARAILLHPGAIAVSGQFVAFADTPQPTVNPPDNELKYMVADRFSFAGKRKPAGLTWWGGLMTMHRSIFQTFGNLPVNCGILDDTFFGTRSLMLGKFVIILNGILIYYRRHGNNIAPNACTPSSIRGLMQADARTRDYYRRGMHCHGPILAEIEQYAASHPDCLDLLGYFQEHFAELRRQGTFWQRRWRERIADARIQGSWWKKIPWAIRSSCPLAWALAQKLGF